MAHNVKWHCQTVAHGGFCLSKGILWQRTRVNARPFPVFAGKLLAECRSPASGFQTDALYRYADGSLLIVSRTVSGTQLAATNIKQRENGSPPAKSGRPLNNGGETPHTKEK